jgi:hypothetical protein
MFFSFFPGTNVLLFSLLAYLYVKNTPQSPKMKNIFSKDSLKSHAF